MKQILLFFLLIQMSVYSQSPAWQWATRAGGSTDDIPASMCTDAAGNIYVVGRFNSTTINFGSIVLTSSGFRDMFLVKYNPSGQVVWAKNAGGADSDNGMSIAIDGSDNIYVAGSFDSDSITFDSFKLYNYEAFTSFTNLDDIFIVKYNTSGDVIWAQSGGGSSRDDYPSVSVDNAGNVFLSGNTYSDTITFGTVSILQPGSNIDAFIVKINSSGSVNWIKAFGGSENESSHSLTNDNSGNIYLTGYFASPTLSFDAITLTNTGNADCYLVKFDNDGNALWANSIGGSNIEQPYFALNDNSDNIYLAGSFISDTAFFDSIQIINTQSGSSDIFLAKFDASGNYSWVKKFGGTKYENPVALAFDGVDNVYITGPFYSDTIYFENYSLINSGGMCFPAECPDIFLTKITPSGNVNWATSFGGYNWDATRAITIDNSNNLYLTGDFYEDTLVFDSTSIISLGNYDIFLSKAVLTVGIDELNKLDSKLTAYPVPASQEINFRTSTNINEKGIMRIFNSQGSLVLSKEVKTFDLKSFDVSFFEGGIYYCEFTVNNTHRYLCKISVIK